MASSHAAARESTTKSSNPTSKAQMTKYACPHCNGHIKAGPGYAGKRIPCPHCAVVIEIPWQPVSQGPADKPGSKVPALKKHRLMTNELLGTARPPTQWGTFLYMLIVWLAAGAANIGWLVYLNWGADYLPKLGYCLGGAWGIALTATVMVRKNYWVKAWAITFGVVSLIAMPLAVPTILTANTSINQKVPAIIVALCSLAMLVVALETLCSKRKRPVVRAKIISQ